MADEAELRTQVRGQEAQKAEHEREKRNLEDQIIRLQAAEKKVQAEKKIIYALKDAVAQQRNPDKKHWDGNMKTQYKDFISNDFKADYQTYFKAVDTMQDTISRKITFLQNQASDLTGIIGVLTRSINSLWGEIKTLFN